MSAGRLKPTPWQTVGPFFHYALPWKGCADLVEGAGELGARIDLSPEGHDLLGARQHARGRGGGEVLEIFGRVLDGEGQPVPDALIEIWQADPQGQYASDEDGAGFIGFGRAATDAEGVYRFRTLKPGRVQGPGNSLQAPHIAVGVLGRGLLKRLVTRIYFDGDSANADDPILALVPESRRGALIAQREGDAWRFDICLQGEAETVFFEV